MACVTSCNVERKENHTDQDGSFMFNRLGNGVIEVQLKKRQN